MRDHPSDGSVRRVRDEREAPWVPPSAPEGAFERRELRVGAKALVTDRDRVLLVKERHGDGSTFWTLPGGGVESGESLSECLRREIDEEIRAPATVGERLGRCVYRHTSRPTTTVYSVFDATLGARPEPDPAERVLDHAWVAPTELLPTTLDPVERFIDRSVAATDGDR
ncbi:NUDIX hydrolase [Halorubrum sp. 2020YC2]|uniref:NUDIX hydrolase n=1 Tax=Halorubrum sp. 2020YC2 TaxID=2836432 RepID=UPI001BEC4A37|nr:NUDIX hydrolase [Halorubrum sp. 2020YC2]QWC20227.1 NUDIX hydrolase [Halorubrum sp. 2020YC2]